ncbi:hypothetical protein UUU_00820 [Klebsiella pneumoniae subsp. pneumoniae DSM 30104 = JCM 1662 = NBRC 14940]|nr:hypothetical protein UUU_00820 [Klebsiella pneumoniae subsp. pneumoniae DSM 30104 = JCM 1662 = NBRC 14940]
MGLSHIALIRDVAYHQNQHQQDRREHQRHQREFMKTAIQFFVGVIEDQRRHQAQDTQHGIAHFFNLPTS